MPAETPGLELLAHGFMRHALIACVAIGLAAPAVGTFVVQRRQSLIGDGLGHVAFAGVGLAVLVDVPVLAGAAILAVGAALLLPTLQRSGLTGDLALAIVFYGGIALGYVLLHRSGASVTSALGVLFGSPLTLSLGDALAIAGLAVAAVAVVAVAYRRLVAVTFDEQAARVAGVATQRLVRLLTVVVALVVIGGMYAIGILLVAGMMVVPVAAASQLTHSYRATLLGAAAVGGGSALLGLTAAYYADETPGAAIVLTTIACYVAAVGIRALRSRRQPGTA
jgi:zinc transport system permease protein